MARDSPGRFPRRRLDGTLATADLTSQLAMPPPFDSVWTGTLLVKTPGVHLFAFRTGGADVDLSLDGRRVWREGESPEALAWREATLTAGPHAVRISVHVRQGPAQIEWVWTPPGGAASIVPAAVLAPPAGSGAIPGTPRTPSENWEPEPQDRAFTPQR